MKKSKSKITSKEFDKDFDNGKDMGDFLDSKRAKVNKKVQRINIDFPISFLNKIDKEAQHIGVARTALIKMWLAERLERLNVR
ncbi:Helix-turn-helix protein, CopG family [Candidatus Scalindua japonica]|uniref:Helix-turn-helix protein, CopG family n=1 Tax=Candidatus Scalindua japonica TaxID=1284222 RepID=A0A286TTN4_9BACT|nr:CopG family antitoxin [Candidatus Scalindua japonica]GAX59221.1 Helix-turn-helix protein, CopG family [Candidatus Scalindua japonica]